VQGQKEAGEWRPPARRWAGGEREATATQAPQEPTQERDITVTEGPHKETVITVPISATYNQLIQTFAGLTRIQDVNTMYVLIAGRPVKDMDQRHGCECECESECPCECGCECERVAYERLCDCD
jgi:hypothetical protein